MTNWFFKWLKLHKSNWYYYFYPFIFVLFVFGFYLKYKSELFELTQDYKSEKHKKSLLAAHTINQNLDSIYNNLRAISHIPGIKSLDSHGLNLDLNSRIAVQEIYNSFSKATGVSKIYITKLDFDPNKLDAERGYYQQPSLIIDQIIEGKNTVQNLNDTNNSDEPTIDDESERKVFETIKELNSQLTNYFANNKYNEFENIGFISSEIILNSSIQKKSVDYFVYTIPIFNNSHIVTASISGLLSEDQLLKVGEIPYINIESEPKLSKSLNNTGYEQKLSETESKNSIYNEKILLKSYKNNFNFYLAVQPPLSDFYNSPEATSIQQNFIFSVFMILLGVSVGFVLSRIQSNNRIWLQTKNQELEQELSQKIEEIKTSHNALSLAAQMKELGEVAANVAHEINNPLSIIHGRSDVLIKSIDKNNISFEQLKDGLLKIKNTADRISKIIHGLKSFSRDGSRDPFEEIDLTQLINECSDLILHRLKKFEVTLKTDLRMSSELKISCRSVQISQVIVNLINNSIDAIENFDEKWISLEVYENENHVQFKITDSGKGIPLDVQKKMFETFFTTKGVGKGTGLGLSISKKIIETHNGEFYIDNNSPNTTFIFTLPITQPNESKDPKAA